MFLFQVNRPEQASPIAKLNGYNADLEASIFSWRSSAAKPDRDKVIFSAFNAMGAAAGILDPKSKVPESSPQYQLALRTMRLAKRTMEELNGKGFGAEAFKYPDGSAISVANAVNFFKAGGALAYTNSLQNAAFQDMYFKNYFAILFSPSFGKVDQLSIIRLANALTDAAYVRSATIKMPFSSEADAKAFADFAASGGIPYCKVTSGPEISSAGFANQKIVIFSISYDDQRASAATKSQLPKISGLHLKQYTIAPLQKSEYSREGLAYGDAPTLDQLKTDNLSSAQQKKTPYSFFAEFQYAEKFNEANIESIASAKDAFILLINDYMKYMGVSLDAYSPPELTTFFKAQEGKDFLAEFKKIYESGKFIGSATVEGRKQVADNEKLGMKRADLFQKVANDVLRTCKVDDKLLLSQPAKAAQAVSAWDKPNEVVKAWVDRLTALTSDPERAEYSKLAIAILSGNYDEARKLNSSLKVFGSDFFASLPKQKAALARNEDGTYSVGNADLLEKLLGRCDSGMGLRFEGTLTPKSTSRQRFGAFFVDAVLEPDRGVRFTTSDMDTKVKVDVSSPVRDGEKVTAQVTVFVDINGKDRLFLENSANRLDVSGRAADGASVAYSSISEPAQVEVDGKKAMRYTVTFNTNNDVYVQANAHKGELESGWAWAGAKAEETVKVEYSPTVKAYNSTVTRGATQKLILEGSLAKKYSDGKTEESAVDMRIAFGLRLSSTDQVKLFFSPSPDARVKNEFVYRVEADGQEKEIVVDRGLVMGGKTYSKEDLLSKARDGVVAMKSGGGKGGWLTLDGQQFITQADMERQSLSESPDGTLRVPDPKYSVKRVLATAKDDVPNIALNEAEQVTLDDGTTETVVNSRRRKSQIPLAIPLPDGKGQVKFGDSDSYSAKEIQRLAEQNIIAIIADKQVAGETMRMVYRIDGTEICPLKNFMTGRLPRVEDLFVVKPNTKGQFTLKTYIPDVTGFKIGGQVAPPGKTLKAAQYEVGNTSEVVLLVYPEQQEGTLDVPKKKEK